MKKPFFKATVAGILFLTVLSCDKKPINPIQKQGNSLNAEFYEVPKTGFDGEFHLGNEGRYLVFNTEVGYMHAVDNPSDQVRQNLKNRLETVNHYSWKEFVLDHPNENLEGVIDDDYFSSILSDDKTVQIGQYIYKINPETEQIHAIHVKDKKHYSELLNNNFNSPFVRSFSFNENVLDAIKEQGGDPTPPGLFCGDSYANQRNEDATMTYVVSSSLKYYFHCKIKYFAIGIYFHLKSQIYARTQYYITSWQSKKFEETLKIDNHRIYKVRCQDEAPWYSFSSQGFTNSNDELVSGSYSGSKGLNKYFMKTNFWFKSGSNWIKVWGEPDMYSGWHAGIKFGY